MLNQWPTRFDATNVAQLVNEAGHPSGAALREFLYPDTAANDAVSPKSVGKRLKRHIDDPVKDGNHTLILRKHDDAHKKQCVYRVEVIANETDGGVCGVCLAVPISQRLCNRAFPRNPFLKRFASKQIPQTPHFQPSLNPLCAAKLLMYQCNPTFSALWMLLCGFVQTPHVAPTSSKSIPVPDHRAFQRPTESV
jgi:hypothetical protein